MSPELVEAQAVLGGVWEGDALGEVECVVHPGRKHLYVQPPDHDGLPTFVCRQEASWPDLRSALLSAGVPSELLRGSATAPKPERAVVPLPSPDKLAKWSGLLLGVFPDFRAYLQDEVGLSPEQMRAEGLGARTVEGTDERIVVPVRSESGALVGVRLWNPLLPKSGGRQKVWVPGHEGTQHLLGAHKLRDLDPAEPLLVVEGEPDYLAAVAVGVPAVAVTAGAGSVPKHLAPLAGRRVVVCFDNDDAGRAGARKQAAAYVEAGAAEVWLADVGEHVAETGADLRDWLVKGSGTGESLRAWVAEVTSHPALTATSLAAAERAEKVQERYESLRVEREARYLVAVEEATGLFAGFAGGSLSEMLAEDRTPTPWVVDGLLRRGHKAVLTAAFKVGKTTLLTNVVRALVDEEKLFGRFPVEGFTGSVVVHDYELTREDAADLYERVGIVNADRVHVESLRGMGFSLANPVHRDMTVAYLRRVNCGVWVLDPYARAMRGFGSENSNDDVGQFLATVDQIAAEADLQGVIISAHTGRTEQVVGEEHARGATKIDDDPDARWIYTRDDTGTRFFRAEGRNRVGCDEFAVAYDPDTERLTATTLSRGDSRNLEKAKAATRVVLSIGAEGINATDLQTRMSGSDPKPKRSAIRYAVAQGWLSEEVRKGRAGTWYSPGPEPFDDTFDLRLR